MDNTKGLVPNQELFRMEKSVMSKANFEHLLQLSGDHIAESLLAYICYEHQYNIFGYGLLDPVEFSKMFRFSHSYLVGRHPSPLQIQFDRQTAQSAHDLRARTTGKGIEQSELACLNRLENSLFILGNITLKAVATSVSDTLLVRRCEFLRVLEHFTLLQDTRTGKVMYAYKLDDKFRRNLSSMYLTASRDSLIRLRRSGLSALYIFLLTLRDALFSEGRTDTDVESTPSFEYLCMLADIPQYDEAKYRKRDLNKAIGKIQKVTELVFTLEWVKGSYSERYTPLFHFQPQAGQYVGNISERYIQIQREQERIRIAVHEFKHNLVEACPLGEKRYGAEAETFFFKWIQSDEERDARLFTFALEKTFINLGCGIPSDLEARVKLFRHCAQRWGQNGFDNWLRNIFCGNIGAFALPVFRCTDLRK